MIEESSFNLPDTYGGLPQEENTLEKAKVVVLPIPLEKTTSYSRGTEYGPHAIIEASKNMELYDDEFGQDLSLIGIHTDTSLMKSRFSLLNIEDSIRLIEEKVKHLIEMDKFIISLGGEHSITTGIVNAFSANHKNEFTLLQLDAHADLRESYEGEILSHACVMRRLADKAKIVQAGIRSLSSEEAKFIENRKLKLFFAKDRNRAKWPADIVKAIKTQDVYITFDLDFLDPSIMPAVGTPEPGGCGWEESLDILRAVFSKKNVIGIDFNELCPLGGKLHYPEFLVSKLVYKSIGYKFFQSK